MVRQTISLLILLTTFGLVTPLVTGQDRCDDPDGEEWVKHVYARLMSFDKLAGYAVTKYGRPVTCVGEVTTEFDGNEFGRLRMEFPDDVSFVVETFPPETSVATLSAPSGFAQKDSVEIVLMEYAANIGLSIDWSNPAVDLQDETRIVTYWDPEDGLNASVRLTFRDSTLVAARLSMAP